MNSDNTAMCQVSIDEARMHLAQLVEDAARGEEIVIVKGGTPVARLIAIDEDSAPRPPGLLRGKIWIGDDFDAPLPDEIQRHFDGGT